MTHQRSTLLTLTPCQATNLPQMSTEPVTTNMSTQEHEMLDTSDSDTAPHQGGKKDGYEQVAIPSGRYLTGVRLILVCTRLVVLSGLQRPPSSFQVLSSLTGMC